MKIFAVQTILGSFSRWIRSRWVQFYSHSECVILGVLLFPHLGFSKMRVDDSYRRPDLSNTTTGGGIYRSTPQSSVPRWKVGDQCKAPWNDGTVNSSSLRLALASCRFVLSVLFGHHRPSRTSRYVRRSVRELWEYRYCSASRIAVCIIAV